MNRKNRTAFLLTGIALSFARFSLAEVTTRYQRMQVLEFVVEGYSPYKEKRTRLDIGILEKKKTGAEIECHILDPLVESESHSWSPLDFYTNVLTLAEQKREQHRLGKSDYFFIGDDFNRNGCNQASNWTLTPLTSFSESLTFIRVTRQTDFLSYVIRFVRGSLKFNAFLRITTNPLKDCSPSASLALCQSITVGLHGAECLQESTPIPVKKIVATADLSAGLINLLFRPKGERNKNDLAKVEAISTDGIGVNLADKPKPETDK